MNRDPSVPDDEASDEWLDALLRDDAYHLSGPSDAAFARRVLRELPGHSAPDYAELARGVLMSTACALMAMLIFEHHAALLELWGASATGPSLRAVIVSVVPSLVVAGLGWLSYQLEVG